MDDVDLNLLAALDVLLTEGSVTKAARRLGLSASAMSRTLTRLRAATGDPLLVRAGRALVPTPRATALRDRVHALTREAQAVLRPQAETLDLASLERTFTIRVSEGFLELLAGRVVVAARHEAPCLCLRFVPKPDKEALPLREGLVDLEIGVLGNAAPELRIQALFDDRLVGVARAGHPLLDGPAPTPERYATCDHVVARKDGEGIEPVDAALAALGLRRAVRVVVPGYPDAMRVARQSDLVALVPHSLVVGGAAAGSSTARLALFEVPLPLPPFQISAMWHPRMEADPAHRWLRETVVAICRAAATRHGIGPAAPA